MEIRQLTVADIPGCVRVSADRNWSWAPSTWRMMLSLGPGWGMFSSGELVGTTLVTPYPSLTAVSGVLVASAYGRRGIGRRLVTHALDSGPAALYAMSYGEPLYAQLGFHPVGQVVSYAGTFDGPASGVSRPADDLSSVVALDTAVSGLARPEVWKQLSVRVSSDGVVGTLPAGDSTLIGPVIASSPASACALIADVGAGAGRVRLNVSDPAVMAFLTAGGLTSGDSCTLMVRNIPDVPGDRARYFAPVTLALG